MLPSEFLRRDPADVGFDLQVAYWTQRNRGRLYDRLTRNPKSGDLAPGIAAAVLAALMKSEAV